MLFEIRGLSDQNPPGAKGLSDRPLETFGQIVLVEDLREEEKMKEWFRARNIWGAAIMIMTDEEAGKLAKAVFSYTMNGEIMPLAGAGQSIFAMIMASLQKDAERDAEIALKRAKATEKYRQQKASNDASGNQMISNDENQNQNQIEKKKESKEKDQEKETRFNRFWNAYPRKVAKQTALRAFEKINPDEALVERMIAAIGKWKTTDQWIKDGGQFIPHPATWLNQRRWEDELPKAGGAKASVTAQMYGQRDYSGVNAEFEAQQDREMEEYGRTYDLSEL